MANLTQPTLSPAAASLYTNSQDALTRKINTAMLSLTPQNYQNFYQITSRYPNISKDLVVSMVNQGLTANTPGLGKITSLDGLSQLKQDQANIDKIKSTVKADKGLVGSVADTWKNKIYDPLKGVSRAGFALLRSPYDLVTTLTRDIAQEKNPGLFIKDLSTLGGANTQFGSLVKDVFTGGNGVSTGSGFFIAPESRVSKEQAKAMASYGKIAGESFTIGRWAAKSLGSTPNTTAYKVMSGIVDATLNVALDPTTWLGPGSVTKIVRTGKQLKEAKAATVGFTESGKLAANAEITKEIDAIAAEEAKLFEPVMKKTADKYLKTENELSRVEAIKNKAYEKTISKILNTESNVFKNMAIDKIAKITLSSENISKWITTHPKLQSGELLRAIDRLSADSKNTGGFLDGYIILDEMPQPGKISVGAHGLDEYLVTGLDKAKQPVLLDLGNDFSTATRKEKQLEAAKRTMLEKEFDTLANDFTQAPETRQVFDTLWQAMKADSKELGGPVGSILFSKGAETLGSLIAKVADTKNPEAMQKVSDAIEKIWNVDGYSNIRSIYGKTGGYVITNTEKYLAAHKAEIGNALAELSDPTNVSPVISKLVNSIQDTTVAIDKTKKKLDKAAKAKLEAETRMKDINLLREYAQNDPQLLKKIANDPNYEGLGNILNLPLKNGTPLVEYVKSQVGLIENYGGNIGTDFNKVLKYMLGRRFAEIADVVAAETDVNRVRRFFGKKLDAEMVIALTEAKTSEDVYRVFLEHMGQATTDPKIFKSMSLQSEVGKLVANPLARLVDPVSFIPVKWAETMERSYNRYFIRSASYNLGDLTSLTNGVEDWFSSAQIKIALGGRGQEALIDNTIKKLYASTGNQ